MRLNDESKQHKTGEKIKYNVVKETENGNEFQNFLKFILNQPDGLTKSCCLLSHEIYSLGVLAQFKVEQIFQLNNFRISTVNQPF